jgi:hypothetical protein
MVKSDIFVLCFQHLFVSLVRIVGRGANTRFATWPTLPFRDHFSGGAFGQALWMDLSRPAGKLHRDKQASKTEN